MGGLLRLFSYFIIDLMFASSIAPPNIIHKKS